MKYKKIYLLLKYIKNIKVDVKVLELYQVERAAAPTREDFNEMKRDKMSQMLSDINR